MAPRPTTSPSLRAKPTSATVIRDDVDADPRRRYKGLFSDDEHLDRYPGVSADGFKWEISEGPPIPTHDTSTLVYDDIGSRYLAMVVVDAGSVNPLPGRSANESQVLQGDQLARGVEWNGGSGPSPGETPVHLRFYLRNASMYSFWLS